MPFLDAVGLFNYWTEYPPLHILVRNFVGYEPPKRVEDPMEVAQTLHAVTGGKGRGKSKDRAPLYIQRMIDESKKVKHG